MGITANNHINAGNLFGKGLILGIAVMGAISFLASGKDGYTTFGKVLEEGRGIDTYFDYAESFVNYVKEVGTLTIPEETGVTYIK
ncbi:secreted protein [Beggiatoa sp. SS]|nr:secreted protein [Beggiatoa sp. SS]